MGVAKVDSIELHYEEHGKGDLGGKPDEEAGDEVSAPDTDARHPARVGRGDELPFHGAAVIHGAQAEHHRQADAVLVGERVEDHGDRPLDAQAAVVHAARREDLPVVIVGREAAGVQIDRKGLRQGFQC